MVRLNFRGRVYAACLDHRRTSLMVNEEVKGTAQAPPLTYSLSKAREINAHIQHH